jgi:hypothetical protein
MDARFLSKTTCSTVVGEIAHVPFGEGLRPRRNPRPKVSITVRRGSLTPPERTTEGLHYGSARVFDPAGTHDRRSPFRRSSQARYIRRPPVTPWAGSGDPRPTQEPCRDISGSPTFGAGHRPRRNTRPKDRSPSSEDFPNSPQTSHTVCIITHTHEAHESLID